MPRTLKEAEDKISELEAERKAVREKLEQFAEFFNLSDRIETIVLNKEFVDESRVIELIEEKLDDCTIEVDSVDARLSY